MAAGCKCLLDKLAFAKAYDLSEFGQNRVRMVRMQTHQQQADRVGANVHEGYRPRFDTGQRCSPPTRAVAIAAVHGWRQRGCHGCLWHRQKPLGICSLRPGLIWADWQRLTASFPMLQQPVLGTNPFCVGRTQAFVAAIGPQASGLDVILEVDMQDILDDRLP